LSRPDRLDEADVFAWLATLPAWRLESGHLLRELRTSNYSSAVELLQAQVPIAERLNHHPVVTVGYNALRFEVWTHDRGAITQLDLDYAQALENLIAEDFAEVVIPT
jgi:4a-hydroxytetrahydrobiopterin dehydratase